MTTKELIADCIAKNRRFSIMANFYTFLDALVYDIDSDPDSVRMLCKFNTSAMTQVEPTFGSVQTSTGLQEVIIPYNQVVAVTCLDVSDELLNKFREKFPNEYKKWENANKVEGVSWDASGNVAGSKTYKFKRPEPAIKTTLEDGVTI